MKHIYRIIQITYMINDDYSATPIRYKRSSIKMTDENFTQWLIDLQDRGMELLDDGIDVKGEITSAVLANHYSTREVYIERLS